MTTTLNVPMFVVKDSTGNPTSQSVGKFMHRVLDALGYSKDTPYGGRYQLFYTHANACWVWLQQKGMGDGSPQTQARLWKQFKETSFVKNTSAFDTIVLQETFKRFVAFFSNNNGSGILRATFDFVPDDPAALLSELFDKGVTLSLPPKKVSL